MIVPGFRLILYACIVWLPLLTAMGMAHAGAYYLCGLVLLFSLVPVGLDAALSLRSLDGLLISVPGTIRLIRKREGSIDVVVQHSFYKPVQMVLGISLPVSFRSVNEYLVLRLDPEQKRFSASWRCTPEKRGRFLLHKVYVERASRLGLWNIRKTFPQHADIRVYPNLFEERKRLAAVFLIHGFLGVHAQRQVGKGREFEKLREYIPGDAVEDIHWKATAKRGKLVSKVFQLERTQEIYVVLDAARLSGRYGESFSSAEENAKKWKSDSFLERFIAASLLLGSVAQRQGDRFGLVVFDDRVRRFIPPATGKTHFGVCRDALYTLEARPVNPDFQELCTFLRLRLTRRSLVLILTNLDDPVLAEEFVRSISLVARRHLVLVNVFCPQGVAPLFSKGNAHSIEEIYRVLAGHLRWQELRELQHVLKQQGIALHLLNNETACAQLVAQYLTVKRRQLL
ncbi:MAG TPA: DUF58 domain-containing protein [Candidatus Hydrogenedentes bacterium]|nr:DUF58 domain-containing protein [Candidatus Hydrogenedentota bacterium]HOL76942.1 DUF58 domain-containing protein [Candidatus Hydrogenedentota bacterium]HPO87312.1 DUF58 domain-containing protein [Candidatus Hydrogenedentota bacterium]